MPSYTNKAINTNEMQKWRKALEPESLSQLTNLVNKKANQSDLNITNTNVNSVTSQLAEIMPFTPEDLGAKGDGVTDDTTAITNLFANNQNTRIKFGKNKTYVVTQPINIPQVSNVEIDGNGSTLLFNISSVSNNFQIGTSTPYKTLTVSLTVDKGYTSIDLTGQDITGVSVGDFAVLTADTPINYTNAETIEIVAINGNIVTFSSFINTSMAVTKIDFYKSSNQLTLKNLTFKSTSANAITFYTMFCKNVYMENCHAIGNGSRLGFAYVYSKNGYLLNNSAENYYDNNNVDNRSGYGFALDSNNFYALNCETRNIKHHLTIASKQIKSHNVIFDHFIVHANDSNCPVFWHLVDFHGNAVNCKYINGEVHVSKDWVMQNDMSYDCAFDIRGVNCGVENCKIFIPSNLSPYYAIVFDENAVSGNFFRNNQIIGSIGHAYAKSSGSKSSSMLYTTIDNLDISNNINLGNINVGDMTVGLLTNIKIINNTIVGLINFVGCSQNVLIDKNYIDANTGQTSTHNDIRPHYKNLTNPVINGKNITVSNNFVDHGTQTGNMVWNNSVAPILVTGNTMWANGGGVIYNDATNGTLVQKTNNFIYNDTANTFVGG